MAARPPISANTVPNRPSISHDLRKSQYRPYFSQVISLFYLLFWHMIVIAEVNKNIAKDFIEPI